MSSNMTINQLLAYQNRQQGGLTELSEEQLALVMGGGFWEGLGKTVVGIGAIAAAVVAVVVAPEITIPLAVSAATAALGGAKTAVEGAVEAYDDRDTWDDGAATRSQSAYYAPMY
jgi:hypothetical protein